MKTLIIARHGNTFRPGETPTRVGSRTDLPLVEEERGRGIGRWLKQLGRNPEITRFKGLGEISPAEFKAFIGEDIRLEPVTLEHAHDLRALLRFYMGDNSDERRQYIIDNLIIEEDLA